MSAFARRLSLSAFALGLFDIVNIYAVLGPIQLAVAACVNPATGARQSETPGPKSTADFWAGVLLIAPP